MTDTARIQLLKDTINNIIPRIVHTDAEKCCCSSCYAEQINKWQEEIAATAYPQRGVASHRYTFGK